MARFGKGNSILLALLGVVILQFIGLGALLLERDAPVEEPAPPPSEEETPDDTVMPAWLDTSSRPREEKAPPEGALSTEDILGTSRLISHGLGAVDGESTLNCLEGFLAQYAQGVRVFEVDLRLTSDMQVVLRHDWRGGWQEGVDETAIPTLDAFLAAPLLGRYTPLSFRDLLQLMEDYPDICVITDTKFTDPEIVSLQFQAMVADAKDLGLSYLFDRMAIQVYSQLMFRVVDSVHHFPCYIYTLYAEGFGRTEDAFRKLAVFCADSGISGITMWDHWWQPAYAAIAADRGLQVYAHTVNDQARAAELFEQGIAAVYTDALTPAQLPGNGEKGA